MTRYGDEATCDECGATIVADDSDLDEHGWFWGGVELDKHMNYHRCGDCGPVLVEPLPQRFRVEYGYGFDFEEAESMEDRAGFDLLFHPSKVGCEVQRAPDEEEPTKTWMVGVDWHFMLTEEEVHRFYNLMQVSAGVEMQMMWNIDHRVQVDGISYKDWLKEHPVKEDEKDGGN